MTAAQAQRLTRFAAHYIYAYYILYTICIHIVFDRTAVGADVCCVYIIINIILLYTIHIPKI